VSWLLLPRLKKMSMCWRVSPSRSGWMWNMVRNSSWVLKSILISRRQYSVVGSSQSCDS
jgi:hypothetical protein